MQGAPNNGGAPGVVPQAMNVAPAPVPTQPVDAVPGAPAGQVFAPGPAQQGGASQAGAGGAMNVSNMTGQKRPREETTAEPAAPAKKQTPAAPNGGQTNIDKDLKNAALDYLEQVKKRFENNKEVYDKFLDIMKDFQSRILETSGVIKRVSDLFKGERNLILGFNAFLPEGYKITEEMYQNELHRQREKAAMQARQRSSKRVPVQQRQAAAASKKPPELEYAKNYVSKIRKRFKHSPKTYQQFLNILQNYQEEQKTVKEVYEQVQGLFEGHNDLLSEFARFLPDPDAPQPQYQARQNKPARAMSQRKPVRRGSKDDMLIGRDKPRFMTGPGYKDEMEFFKQFKSRMPLQQWENFLKLLNMFNNKMVTATELKVLMRELFQKPQRIYNQHAKRRANDQDPGSDSPDLYEGLLKFLGMLCCGNASIFDGKKVAPKELHRAPHDRDGGPSYVCRATTTLAVCTGRNNPEWTEVCDAVLNDQYSLNPLGTEQSAVLTNTHEMALFRAEDERYELDTMVGRTSMAIGQIESIADELATLSRAEKQRFDIYDKMGLLPMRTIHKIYGDHGNDMVDLLYDHPAATIPIVLARLKQKDEEYRLVRHQQNRLWQEVFEQNYHKALDHRSYAFKVQDKKALHTKSILMALREVPEGISFTYGVPSRDIQLWYVLKEIIKDLVDAEEATVMTSWWEEWFCPFLGNEIASSMFGTPGKEPEKAKRTSTKTGGKKILYANHTMATMLRLHQMLHSRMLEAKEMAEDDMNETGPSRENQLLGPETPRYNEENQVSPTLAQSGGKRRNKDNFETFVTNLLAMLRQTMDVNKYEDECRTLLGTSSYKVFTLDKLIPRLIKETNNLATSESWRKIKEAYEQFNGIGSDGVKAESLSQAEYRWRMCEEFSHNCFEVVYDPRTHEMNISNVVIDEAEETEKMRRERAQLEAERAAQDEDAEGDEGAEGLNALLQVKSESGVDEGDAGVDEEADGGIDMDVEDEEGASQGPLIRRPALGYGNNADESEEESDA